MVGEDDALSQHRALRVLCCHRQVVHVARAVRAATAGLAILTRGLPCPAFALAAQLLVVAAPTQWDHRHADLVGCTHVALSPRNSVLNAAAVVGLFHGLLHPLSPKPCRKVRAQRLPPFIDGYGRR